ncbi:DUF1329 domain-containing protein [Algiphilus sp.]|uniref:DUF1329 domain-containing protein n=1 Tax=Algiphilus sp. TaxID=1872431 RepID=UPI0032EE6040|nr:DUF1329 domain-containing protein [Hyphomonas sp.]
MRIRKYDVDYTRRKLMQNMALGLGAGVLLPLEKIWAKDALMLDLTKAYPDEAFSIEAQTKGKISVGDVITKENLEHVEHLLDPCIIQQVREDGRRFTIGPPETDLTRMFTNPNLEKTQKNLAEGYYAKFDANGNVVGSDNGNWKGGFPFPSPRNANEIQANAALSWGRADANLYAVRQVDFAGDGSQQYAYDFAWVELQMQARIDGKAFRGHTDEIRRQNAYFESSEDVKGTSFLSIWKYDQREIPDLFGYLPQFRRVRQFPANQRFEPLIPGATWFLTDPWAAGDPMLTWGNYKIVERKPMLTATTGNFGIKDDNWQLPTIPGNEKYFDVALAMSPDVAVVESTPTGYPRAPVSKRLAWFDVRNCTYTGCIRYDLQGKPWVNFESAFGYYQDGDRVVMGHDGKTPAWSWTYVMSYNMQNKRMSRLDHAYEASGIRSLFEIDQDWMYDTYLTTSAQQALGRV